MKAITKKSMAMMIAIALSGCNGDMLEMQSGDGMVAIEVKNVLSVETDITESRAASILDDNGAKMGVFRIKDDQYTALDNVEYTYSSYTGKWTSTAPILVGVQATNLCAYYPYNSVTFTTGTTATLEASKYEEGKDVSYATSAGSTVTNQNPKATFAMKHAYARIKLAIKRSEDKFNGKCNISTVNLRNNSNFFVKKNLNISTGEYDGSAEDGGWTCSLESGDMSAGSTNNAYDVLVPPQSVNTGLTITLVVDGVERSATISADLFSSNLKAGTQYSISLLLTDLEVIPSSNVTIIAWKADNTNLNNEFEATVSSTTINVPASEINLGGTTCSQSDKEQLAKLTWAGGNLKSSDNTERYGYTPLQTQYGYYYTWNSTYTGDNSRTGIDPCTLLSESMYGSGWRTPGKVELEMLSRCTDNKFTNGGMWFMNNSKGLFLPFAGRRSSKLGSGDKPGDLDGKEGFYWSIDGSSSSGYYLSIYNGGSGVYGSDTSQGSSVRCVRGELE